LKPTRRQFLQTSALAGLAVAQPLRAETDAAKGDQQLDAFAIAREHSVVRDLPTPDFFEGMLLGNGDVGVCIVVRPDALGLHIGKNDCWDIRLSEDSQNDVLPFPDFIKLWQRASEEAKRQGKPEMLFLEQNIDFFRDYTRKAERSYSHPWPHPWPCGTTWLHWDSRWVRPGMHTLDPSNGSFTLHLDCTHPSGTSSTIKLISFVDWDSGVICVSTDVPVPISTLSYYPQVDQSHPPANGSAKNQTDALPPPEVHANSGAGFGEFSCFQYFPAIGPTEKVPAPPRSSKDRNFALHARIAGEWSVEPRPNSKDVLLKSVREQSLRLCIALSTPRDLVLRKMQQARSESRKQNAPVTISQSYEYSGDELDTLAAARSATERFSSDPIVKLLGRSEARWREFWERSAIELNDKELERIWYRNQYFLACCLRAAKTAPGLFANWSSRDLGSSWHGDYHLDYNCQQVFWGVFASNHVEQHLPYLELCQNLLKMCEEFTKEKFQLPGACFPLTAVPVPSQDVFIATPPFAYQVSNTPWTVQSLWWHYLYTQDTDYLKTAYPILKAAAVFLAAYAKKEQDGKYHLNPTASPENWGCTVDFRLNKDCILDIALTQFLLDAVIEASSVLDVDQEERTRWREIRGNLAAYPTGKGPYGEVWLDILDAPTEAVYNVPVTLGPVFPAEQVGLGCQPEQLELARRTAQTVRLEGGNDLVFQPLARARLGILDLEWFKREVRYCTLPNGVANDRVRQIGGRYDDSTDFDFMMRMGFWTENFSLPAVLNECLMQSYTGTIYLFPNTENLGPARFHHLRAAGAFLVSAGHDGKQVTHVVILSEKGKKARLASPWGAKDIKVTRISDGGAIPVQREKDVLTFDTGPNESYRITPKS